MPQSSGPSGSPESGTARELVTARGQLERCVHWSSNGPVSREHSLCLMLQISPKPAQIIVRALAHAKRSEIIYSKWHAWSRANRPRPHLWLGRRAGERAHLSPSKVSRGAHLAAGRPSNLARPC